jgi:hypothetical protein
MALLERYMSPPSCENKPLHFLLNSVFALVSREMQLGSFHRPRAFYLLLLLLLACSWIRTDDDFFAETFANKARADFRELASQPSLTTASGLVLLHLYDYAAANRSLAMTWLQAARALTSDLGAYLSAPDVVLHCVTCHR